VSRFGRVRRLTATGSTNDDMARILGETDARGLTIVADYQQHGSGRKGRQWLAPPGTGLLFTTALPDPLPASDLWILPFWMALVVRRTLLTYDIHSLLQWPNDLLIEGRKAGGILCIARVTGQTAWVAAGVGINVTRPDDDETLKTIDPPPAFLSDYRTIDRDDLLQTILQCADEQYPELQTPDAIALRWESAANVPGARYTILEDQTDRPFEAVALRLARGGGLIVRVGERIREIGLADARVLRAG